MEIEPKETTYKMSLWEKIKWWWWNKIGRHRAGRKISKAIEDGSFFKIAEEENYTIYTERKPTKSKFKGGDND